MCPTRYSRTRPFFVLLVPVGSRSYGDTFVIEIANFVRAITEKKTFHPNFEDGVECQRVVEAVEKLAAERRWISIHPGTQNVEQPIATQ